MRTLPRRRETEDWGCDTTIPMTDKTSFHKIRKNMTALEIEYNNWLEETIAALQGDYNEYLESIGQGDSMENREQVLREEEEKLYI